MHDQDNETSSNKEKFLKSVNSFALIPAVNRGMDTFPTHEDSTVQKNNTSIGGIYDIEGLCDTVPTQLLINEAYSIPDEIRDRLHKIPDHVEEARKECVRQFIIQILLHRMTIQDPLLVDELSSLATNFKLAFTAKHPKDFVGEFEIIPSVEMELMSIHLRIKQKDVNNNWVGLSHLVKRALYELKILLDENPEQLLAI